MGEDPLGLFLQLRDELRTKGAAEVSGPALDVLGVSIQALADRLGARWTQVPTHDKYRLTRRKG